jgi:phosphomannomutase
MDKIKFGTDGWRALIAEEFTVENVARISRASALWLMNQCKEQEPRVVIGYDCRFAGKMFAETAARVFAHAGVKVYLSRDFVSTPMVSLGILQLKATLGVVITASHNPPEYNGFKLKGHYGGPLLENALKNIEDLVPPQNEIHLDSLIFQDYLVKGLIEYHDLEQVYIDYVTERIDLDVISRSGFRFAFDAMYGSGQGVFRRLLPETVLLHCERDVMFGGIPPEPLEKNLKEFSELIRKSKNIDCGLAVDGDADRIALFDKEGRYVDSHHIILLLIHVLSRYKKLHGLVVTGFSSTVKVEKLCAYYGLEVKRVKIGFKDICKVMLQENVLVGGEESGGIAVSSHIPERDGIWMGLIIWQIMAETGKSIEQLVEEVYTITGRFAFERSDLRLEQDQKMRIIEACQAGRFSSFGDYQVKRVETLDGFKYYFSESEWLMIRPSGTEPLLRTYAEAESPEEVRQLLEACYETIMKV